MWNCTHFRHPTDEQLRHVDKYFLATKIICSLSTLNYHSMLKGVEDFRDKSLLRSLTELKDPMVVLILTVHSSTLETALTSLRPLELKSWCVPFFFLVKC